MTIHDDLGRWDPPPPDGWYYLSPAFDGVGYQWQRSLFDLDKRPRIPTQMPIDNRVIRAIPVEGVVSAVPDWSNSPQARFWLDKPKKSLGKRIHDWLMGVSK